MPKRNLEIYHSILIYLQLDLKRNIYPTNKLTAIFDCPIYYGLTESPKRILFFLYQNSALIGIP